jgi:hypothetical protein
MNTWGNHPIHFTPKTRISLPHVSLTLAEIWELERVCILGLPDTLTPELKAAVELLVCLSINPMRPIYPAKETTSC